MEGIEVIPYGTRWGVTCGGWLMKTFQYRDFAIAYARDSAREDARRMATPDGEKLEKFVGDATARGKPLAASEEDRRCNGVTCLESGQRWLKLSDFLKDFKISKYATRIAHDVGAEYVIFEWAGRHYMYRKKQATHGRPVICNETGQRFDSTGHAACTLGLERSSVYKYCRGLRATPVKGYTFRFEEETK